MGGGEGLLVYNGDAYGDFRRMFWGNENSHKKQNISWGCKILVGIYLAF